jgi:hypothetical protein
MKQECKKTIKQQSELARRINRILNVADKFHREQLKGEPEQ